MPLINRCGGGEDNTTKVYSYSTNLSDDGSTPQSLVITLNDEYDFVELPSEIVLANLGMQHTAYGGGSLFIKENSNYTITSYVGGEYTDTVNYTVSDDKKTLTLTPATSRNWFLTSRTHRIVCIWY